MERKREENTRKKGETGRKNLDKAPPFEYSPTTFQGVNHDWEVRVDKESMDKELQSIFQDYMEERGFIPDYAQFLVEENPEFLVSWFNTRRSFRGKGVLPEKFKEFLLMACNAIRLNETGVGMHIEAAVKMGATRQEMMEVALCAWLIGGMPSLNVCLRGLMKKFPKQ